MEKKEKVEEREQEINKWNINDKLFFMNDNVVNERKIKEIGIGNKTIIYKFFGLSNEISQNDCFLTKEELLKSL